MKKVLLGLVLVIGFLMVSARASAQDGTYHEDVDVSARYDDERTWWFPNLRLICNPASEVMGAIPPGFVGDGYSRSDSAFKGCGGTCGSPCKATECHNVCNDLSKCLFCCGEHFRRSVEDCKGRLMCTDTQTTEKSGCEGQCGGDRN